MGIKGYNNIRENKMSIPYIIGFALLFTPLFFVGIIIIIWCIIKSYKKEAEGKSKDFNKTAVQERKITSQKKFDRKIWSAEKMSKEDRKNYEEYCKTNNSYEQAVRPILKKRNPSNKCEVCRNIHSKPTSYCEVCGELFDDGLMCTFCKTKNELNSTYCKNCGVKFIK